MTHVSWRLSFFGDRMGGFARGRLPRRRPSPTVLAHQTASSIDRLGGPIASPRKKRSPLAMRAGRWGFATMPPPSGGRPSALPWPIYGLRQSAPALVPSSVWTTIALDVGQARRRKGGGGKGTSSVGHLYGRSRCRVMLNANSNRPREGYWGFRQFAMFLSSMYTLFCAFPRNVGWRNLSLRRGLRRHPVLYGPMINRHVRN